MKKKFQHHKIGFDLGAECWWLSKNLIMYHLHKNVRSTTNKARSEKFGIPRKTILTRMKDKNKLSQSFEQTSSNIMKLRGCDYE